MVTPIIAALFGSSYHLISGPTTAISIVMFSTISRHVEPGSPEFISMAHHANQKVRRFWQKSFK
jgi:SulP family sulfate permease